MVYVHVRSNAKDDEMEPIQRKSDHRDAEVWSGGSVVAGTVAQTGSAMHVPQMALEVRRDPLKRLLTRIDARYLDAGDPEKKRLMPKQHDRCAMGQKSAPRPAIVSPFGALRCLVPVSPSSMSSIPRRDPRDRRQCPRLGDDDPDQCLVLSGSTEETAGSVACVFGGGARRTDMGFKKAATAAAVALASSSIELWPRFLKITSLAPLMSFWKWKASALGSQLSLAPHRIRVGTSSRWSGVGSSGSCVRARKRVASRLPGKRCSSAARLTRSSVTIAGSA